MDNVAEWQHPFVDVFKKYNTFDAAKSYKGSVSIIHVRTYSFRIPSSLARHSKSVDLFYPITPLPYLIPMEKSNIATSSEDM